MEVTLGARGVALGVVGAAATGAVVAILLGAAGGGWFRRWSSWAVGGGEHRPRAKWRLPSRIILLRHGQSLGNVKESAYRVIPDWQIPLTEHGKMQARLAAAKIVEMIGDEQVVIYYSPYTRVLQTLDPLLEAVPPGQLLSVQEEPRIREQDFGNYQDSSMKDIKKERVRFGRFFYRFPEGESVADVYDRISSFFETIFRQFKRSPICNLPPEKDFALVIVSHGITLRLFIMRWFLWTVKDFEKMKNPPNCHPITLVRRDNKGHHYEMDHESQGRLGVTSTMPSTGQYQLPLHYTPHWYS